MRVGTKLADAQSTANLLLARLRHGTDEAAVFTFDTQLHQVQPYMIDATRLKQSLSALRPFGATSLYDAIAETAHLASQVRNPNLDPAPARSARWLKSQDVLMPKIGQQLAGRHARLGGH